MNKKKFEKWKQNYAPKNIKVEKYEVLDVEITQLKMVETIKEAPLHKATGPTMISNEILKKLLTKGYKVITKALLSANNIALPNTFTAQSIQQISYIQENTQLVLQRIQIPEATIKLIINIFNGKTNRVIIMLRKPEPYDI
ncbi:1623_t:CDS:2, partial [Gigaspora margarita]